MRDLLGLILRMTIVFAIAGAIIGGSVALLMGSILPMVVYTLVFAAFPWFILGMFAAIDRCFK